MYVRRPTRTFKKSLRKIADSGNNNILKEIKEIIKKIALGERLSERYKDHKLSGKLEHCRECHIRPDLLLIYHIDQDDLVLVDIGSHSELFG